jgi:hypothetical protein
MRPFTNQHSVHLAPAFLFGAMDRQAPQQEGDDVFVCVVMYHCRRKHSSVLPPAVSSEDFC